MDYGQQLRQELRRQGKTQAWLAEALGVSVPAVNHWMKGRQPVPQDRRAVIEDLLQWRPLTGEQVDMTALAELYAAAGTPLSFLMHEPVPDCLQTVRREHHTINTPEHFEYATRMWAKWLNVDPEYLVRVALTREYFTASHLVRFFEAGVYLTFLGHHLGEMMTQQDMLVHLCDELARQVREGVIKDTAGMREAIYVAEGNPRPMVPVGKTAGQDRAIKLLEDRWDVTQPTAADQIYKMWLEGM